MILKRTSCFEIGHFQLEREYRSQAGQAVDDGPRVPYSILIRSEEKAELVLG